MCEFAKLHDRLVIRFDWMRNVFVDWFVRICRLLSGCGCVCKINALWYMARPTVCLQDFDQILMSPEYSFCHRFSAHEKYTGCLHWDCFRQTLAFRLRTCLFFAFSDKIWMKMMRMKSNLCVVVVQNQHGINHNQDASWMLHRSKHGHIASLRADTNTNFAQIRKTRPTQYCDCQKCHENAESKTTIQMDILLGRFERGCVLVLVELILECL